MAFNKPRKATKTVKETFEDKTHTQKEKRVMFNTIVPEHVHRKLKAESFVTGESMAKIIARLVDEHIEDRTPLMGRGEEEETPKRP